MSCARPIAMPPETPMPCSRKLIGPKKKGPGSNCFGAAAEIRAWPLFENHSSLAPFSSRSRALPEFVGDQRHECIERGRLVVAFRFEHHFAALVRGQHHHAHDAFRIDLAAIARKA